MFECHDLYPDSILVCGSIEFGINTLNSDCWFSVSHVVNSCSMTVCSDFDPQLLSHSVVTIHPNLFPVVTYSSLEFEVRFDDVDCYKQFCRHFYIKPSKEVLEAMEAQ